LVGDKFIFSLDYIIVLRETEKMKIVHLLFLWLLIANLADLITTIIGVQFPNIYESNRIMAYFLSTDLILFIVVKLAVPALAALGFLVLHNFCKRWINKLVLEIGILSIAISFSICTINNILIIAKCL
jgi:hypothetical protein